MKIIYFHGFASVGSGAKATALRLQFPDDTVLAPDLPVDPKEVISLVDSLVRENPSFPLIFVGTSLGGFYASYFSARYDCPCVLVNPSTNPSNTMLERMSAPQRNYATGEEIIITQGHLVTFRAMEDYIKGEQNGALVNLFLAEDDDVIPYDKTLVDIPFAAFKEVKKTGGHRFTEHWGEVCKFLNKWK